MSVARTVGERLDGIALKRRGLTQPPFHLGSLLGSAARERPHAIWVCGRGEDEAISYGEASALAFRAAGAFVREGLAPSDRVLLLMPNHIGFGVLVWGAWLAGGVVCALHPAYPHAALATPFNDIAPHTLVTTDDAELLAKAIALVAGTKTKLVVLPRDRRPTGPIEAQQVSLADWLADTGPTTPRYPDVDAIALLQFTGGSTGVPKAAVLTHRNISTNLAQLIQSLPQLVAGSEKLLAIAPFAHVIGFTVNLCLGTYLSSTVVLERRFDTDATAQLCLEYGITFINAVPTLLEGLRYSPVVRAGQWNSLKCVISGGAPLPSATRTHFESLTGCDVLEGYGLSETSPAVLLGHPRWGVAAGSVGRPIAETGVAITATGDPGQILERDEVGEIRISGPQVMLGYWQRPDETNATIVDGLLRTGDLGKLDCAGNVHVVGRLKDLIIASGYNVYPSRVEDAILANDAVAEAAVIGVPDTYRGENVKAVVVLRTGCHLTLPQLQEWLKPRISPMEMPRLLEIRDSLPKSPAGKILKTALRGEK